MTIVFFGGSLEAYNIVPPVFNWSTEPLIYILFVFSSLKKAIHGGSFSFPFLPQVLFFFIIGIVSGVVNSNISINALFGIRLIIRFYVFYLAVLNLELNEKQARSILLFLTLLFLVQIPTSIVKLIIFGQGERAIGTYSAKEGSLSTMIPLIAIGYIAPLYLYKRKLWTSIILSLGFIAFSFIGGKRALVFMLPLLIFFMLGLIGVSRWLKKSNLKISLANLGFLIPVFLLIFVAAGLKFIPTLNPEKKIGGSINFTHAIEFAAGYTNNTMGVTTKVEGKLTPTGGRLSTSKRIFSVMTKEGIVRFLIGYGPGSFTESRFNKGRSQRNFLIQKFNIIYGITPLGYIQVEYGFMGVLVYLSILISILVKCITGWLRETDAYWEMHLFGSSCFAFIMILLWSYYHPPSMLGDTIPCVFFLLMGIAFTRIHAVKKNEALM
nr:hypothetical protein [uncultured Desulfobacter sp.]